MIKALKLSIILLLIFSCKEEKKTNIDQFIADDVTVKNSAEVISELDKQLQENPNDANLLIKKAMLCRDNYNFNCVLENAAKAYRLDSNSIAARDIYAWTLINKSTRTLTDIDNAQKHFEYVLSKKPKDPQAYVNLANTYSLKGDFKKSFQYINEGLKIDKNFRDAYILKGSNYRIIGDTNLAISSFETALQVDPTYVEGYLNVADYYVEIGNPIALEYYQTAYDLNPTSKEFEMRAIYGIAKTKQDLGKYKEALEGYRELLDVDSMFFIAYFNTGYIKQFHQLEIDSAVYYYNLALDINPQYVPGWHNLGLAYLDQERKPDAARAFSEVMTIAPEYAPTKEAIKLLK